jgi:hypothetical protein
MKKLLKIIIALAIVTAFFKTLPAVERPTLAVMPFIIDQSIEIRIGDLVIVPSVIENEFSDQVLQNLVKSRKFDVLERANVKKIMIENNLTESDYAKPGEAERIGKLLVADYLVVGYIDRVEFILEQKNIQITGERSLKLTGTFKTHFRVVETKSGKIVCAQSIENKLKSSDIPFQERKDMTGGDFRDRLFGAAAVKSCNYILEGIYPIKIASISGNELTLNRGDGSGLVKGDHLDVFELGDSVKDPDTGEVLGSSESKVAEIEVTDVLQKFSKAKIISSTGIITDGSICRRIETAKTEEAPATPRITPGW